ncbi:Shedu immune nuclease family protein [Methylobacterium sp. Leaf456]|uniref:Shedu immune nuclease family protein n=1 Tax=Methylobacterium sp. Leaf456 TaxID=1736382 RepID=UPI0009E780B9|nr:Shedu immune nuclease family protein [Methylobacterium sp. Leaf456]
MRRLARHNLDPAAARVQLTELSNLIATRSVLRERDDVLPFFRTRPDICLMFSYYLPDIKEPDWFAIEFVIYGDFRADLIVGDFNAKRYMLIEFEDGSPNSIFSKKPKTAPAWASRMEGAFSQIVDWYYKLDDMKATNDFANTFGDRDAVFEGLIVTGKDMKLAPQEKARLKWRIENVRVASKKINTISFDEFVEDADFRLRRYHNV